MGQFYLVVPQGTTNLHKNPSIEYDATGFTAVGSGGSSVTRISTESYKGAYSLRVLPGTTNTGGHYYSPISLTSGLYYTFSVYVKGVLAEPYKLYIANSGGTALATATFTGTGEWQRVEVTYLETSTSTTRRLYVTKNGGSTTNTAFYVDACQIENLAFSTTYCDGDQEGCRWAGGSLGEHRTASARSSLSRAGGIQVDLEDYGAYLVSQSGTGMPGMKNTSTPYGASSGSYWRGQLATERSFTIAFSLSGNGVPDWHSKRQALIDLIKPDLVYPQQDFILGYTDGGDNIEIRCHYDGGFEIADGRLDIETLPIKLIASDPFWSKPRDFTAFVDAPTHAVLGSTYAAVYNSVGDWSAPGASGITGGAVNVAKAGADGYWYFGGAFTSCGGVANTANFARYDPSTDTFTSIGTFNGEVLDIAIDNFGNVIAAGKFTTITGVSIPYIGKYVLTTGAWSQLASAAPNNWVTKIAVAGNNNTYIVGTFTTIGGVGIASSAYFASDLSNTNATTGNWFTWSSFSSTPTGMMIKPHTQQLYVFGTFTTAGGIACQGIAVWDVRNGVMAAVAAPSATVNGPTALCLSGDGSTLYAAWKTTTTVGAGLPNAGNTYHIVVSNSGSGWVQLGSGDGFIDFLNINPFDDSLYASSNRATSPTSATGFRYMNGIFLFGAAIYIGNRWVHAPTFMLWSGVAWDELGNSVYWANTAGGNAGSTDEFSVTITATNNGSAEVHPQIHFKGYGRFMWAKNWTTGATIYLADLTQYHNDGEHGTIDTDKGTVYTNRRPSWQSLLAPNSEIGRFSLLPGDNDLELYFDYYTAGSEASRVDMWVQWQERYWSIDGGI